MSQRESSTSTAGQLVEHYHRLRAGDRVLAPYRGHIQQVWGAVTVIDCDDHLRRSVDSQHVKLASREPIGRCFRCGMWKYKRESCWTCEAVRVPVT